MKVEILFEGDELIVDLGVAPVVGDEVMIELSDKQRKEYDIFPEMQNCNVTFTVDRRLLYLDDEGKTTIIVYCHFTPKDIE